MSKSTRRAVPGVRRVIDLAENSELWEDFYDCADAASRADEPVGSIESVKDRLRARKRRGARG